MRATKRPKSGFSGAIARAEDRISRLDERVAACGFGAGWRERADIRAVLAAVWQGGDLVHAEDLILHALAADLRIPDRSVLRAHACLRGRQKMWLGGAEMLSWRGVAWATGRTRVPPPPGPRPSLAIGPVSADGALLDIGRFFERLEARATGDARAATEECLEVLDLTANAPALLAAAALVEAWRVVDPLPVERGLGALLASQVLRVSGRFTAGLFPLEVALKRRAMPARVAWSPLPDRLQFWFETMERSAVMEAAELSRLATQKTLIERMALGGRRSGKAPALAALAVNRPMLTTELVARDLGVTPQGAGLLLKRFSGVLQEITGRSAYRVWRL